VGNASLLPTLPHFANRETIMTEYIEPPPGKYLTIPVTIRFGDTDPFGVVYFVSYFRYCHHAIEEFLRHLGFRPGDIFRNPEEEYGLPVVGASCDFCRPMRYGDPLRVAIHIVEAKSKSITFGFRFFHSETEELVGRGTVTVVTIGPDWHSKALPEKLREAIAPYLPPAGVS
jgi:acyl-CoA thioester hydrolase